MRLRTSTRPTLRRIKQFIVYKILHVDDTPHRIALGVAIGVFVAWMPLPGLQMILVLAVAALLGGNKVVGLPLVWLNNPLTAPVNLLCYRLGCWMLRIKGNGAKIVQAIQDALAPGVVDVVHRFVGFFRAVQGAFWPWLVGSIVIGLATGAATYLLTYRAVVGVRRRRTPRQRRPAGQKEAAVFAEAPKAVAAQVVTEPAAPPQLPRIP